MRNYLTALLFVVSLAACASPNSRYYTLSVSYPAATQSKSVGSEHWMLDGVTIPEMLNRPQMVLRSGQNGVDVLEYERWAEPMDSMVYRILADNLTARLGTTTTSSTQDEKHITVAIDEWDADTTGAVILTATWKVRTDTGVATYRFSRTEKADVANISAVVAAQSHLLGELADAIAKQP